MASRVHKPRNERLQVQKITTYHHDIFRFSDGGRFSFRGFCFFLPMQSYASPTQGGVVEIRTGLGLRVDMFSSELVSQPNPGIGSRVG